MWDIGNFSEHKGLYKSNKWKNTKTLNQIIDMLFIVVWIKNARISVYARYWKKLRLGGEGLKNLSKVIETAK